MSELTGEQIDAMEMRAWRFWVTYLGFGYLQDMFFIPNANVFIEDILHHLNLPQGAAILLQRVYKLDLSLCADHSGKRHRYAPTEFRNVKRLANAA